MSTPGPAARPTRRTRSPIVGVCVAALAVVALGPSPSSRAAAGTAPSGRIVFVSDRNGSPDIYVMNADGTDQVRLTFDWATEYYPRWSPDGTRILFQRYGPIPSSRLFTMNPDGTDVHPVPNVHFQEDPSWSPDGARIAFAHPGSVLDNLGVEWLDGSHRRAVLRTGWQQRPDWSGDGRWIAFDGAVEDFSEGIFRIRPDGTGLIRLTTTPTVDLYPRWSPDDHAILFSRDVYSDGHYGSDLFVMDPDGTGQTNLTNEGGASQNSTPCWSPDGRMIAFYSDRAAPLPYPRQYDIYVMNADGSGVVRLTDQGNNFSPDWAPAAA